MGMWFPDVFTWKQFLNFAEELLNYGENFQFFVVNKSTVTAITGNIFVHKGAGRVRFDTYTKWHKS